jgi:Domain of unknown function (DUF4160)
MPVYEFLDGIKISVYSNDHVPPHIHASIGEREVLIDIQKVEVLIGSLPKSQLRKVLAFVVLNQNDLLEEFFNLNPTIKKI